MRWTVYCRVVDNYGDVGVSWRLANDLAARGERVSLVVDDAGPIAWMQGDAPSAVRVVPWGDDAGECPDVAVETFGCGLPAGTVDGWQRLGAAPLHVDVEHLSAEAYVERSHGGVSPADAAAGRPVPRWFFFPGFTERTGGLLRERRQPVTGDDFAAGRSRPSGGDVERRAGERVVSAFCYDSAAFPALLDRLATQATCLLCAPGAATRQARTWVDANRSGGAGSGRGAGRFTGARAGAGADIGALRIVERPFVSQDRYDERLRLADLNIVRGEDSFVRAIWAAKPFIWHVYPQHDGADRAKLAAFLDVFLRDAEPALGAAIRASMRAWNEGDAVLPALPPLAEWQAHCERFAAGLARQTDLTTRLIEFVTSKR